ncbi:hypothetical protein R50073_07380 [Maricurvus nonylphenolicus]|uniref:hypothetical protein n=1 Tax=Maricurvus nonylphenolicus TaxID=1008307 RepID=UPI0036F28829
MKLINFHWLCVFVLTGLLAACSSLQQIRSVEYTAGETTSMALAMDAAKAKAEEALSANGFMETGREKHGNKFYLYGESAGEGTFEPGNRKFTTGKLVRIVLVEEGASTQAYVLVREKVGFDTSETGLVARRLVQKLGPAT